MCGAGFKFAADASFINLNVARQPAIPVHLGHVVTDQVRHTERRGIAHAQLALKLLSGHAVARGREEIDGIEPLGQGRMRVLKDGALHRVDMMPAIAGVGRELRELPKSADFSALRAPKVRAKSQVHEVLEASLIIWKTIEKVLNCQLLGHMRRLPHA